jgi:hypothetical protein
MVSGEVMSYGSLRVHAVLPMALNTVRASGHVQRVHTVGMDEFCGHACSRAHKVGADALTAQ